MKKHDFGKWLKNGVIFFCKLTLQLQFTHHLENKFFPKGLKTESLKPVEVLSDVNSVIIL